MSSNGATDIEVVTLDGGQAQGEGRRPGQEGPTRRAQLDDGKSNFRFARLGDSDKVNVGDWG